MKITYWFLFGLENGKDIGRGEKSERLWYLLYMFI